MTYSKMLHPGNENYSSASLKQDHFLIAYQLETGLLIQLTHMSWEFKWETKRLWGSYKEAFKEIVVMKATATL